MVIAFLIVLGLCLGSFINAFVWRFHAGTLRSLLTGRSECPHCHHRLTTRELIPVVSYFMLGRRCSNPKCRKPIDDTPVAEIATPLVFVLSYVYWPSPLSDWLTWTAFAAWLVYVAGFVALALYDLRWFELPHRIVLPLTGLAAVQAAVAAVVVYGGWSELLRTLEGALIGGGLFLVIYLISPKQTYNDGTVGSKWIGFGDITLGTLLGLLVGSASGALLLIFMASLIGTVVALPLMALGRAHRNTHLPFGPFLLAAAIIVKLWGPDIITWYTGLLGV